MILTVRHKVDNTIYYVTERMYKNSTDVFEIVEKEEKITPDTIEGPTEEERLEVLRGVLRDRGISFHPNCSEKTLRKKIEESE